MLQNQEVLKSKVRCLTFKFAAVGWVAAALTMGVIVSNGANPSLFAILRHSGFVAACMAAVTFVPLALSTLVASKWISSLAANEEQAVPNAIKYFYASLFTILIAVGGAGLFTVVGSGIYRLLDDLFAGRDLKALSYLAKDFYFTALLIVAYPVVIGLWIEIPMVFIYSHKIRKLIQAHQND